MQPCSGERRSILRPADPAGGIWAMWPSAGDLRPEARVADRYTLRVSLSRRIEDVDDTVRAVSARLSLFHLMVDDDSRDRTRLTFTLDTPDLWQAILLTMNAIAGTGHTPVALSAEPAMEYETDPGSGCPPAVCSTSWQ